MTTRGDSYVQQLDPIFSECLTLVDQVDDARWTSIAGEDGRQINVLVDHIAGSQANLNGLVRMIAAGQDLPTFNLDVIEHGNQAHIAEARTIDRATVIAKLNAVVSDYRQLLPSLTDVELDSSKPIELFGGETSAATVIEQAMIGHSSGHVASLRNAVAQI